MMKDNIDILLISETKIDPSFPTVYFNESTSYRRNRNTSGGGILLYVRYEISSSIFKVLMSLLKVFTWK